MKTAHWAAGFTAAMLLIGCGDEKTTDDGEDLISIGSPIDANKDNIPDDANMDGVADRAVDSDGDGIADGIDVDGNGSKDKGLNDPGPGNAGGGSSGAATAGSTGTPTGGSTGNAATGGSTGSSAGGSTGAGSSGGSTGATTGGTSAGANNGMAFGEPSGTAVKCEDQPSCDLATKSCCGDGIPMLTLKFTCSMGTTCSKGKRTVCDGSSDCPVGKKACCVAVPAGDVTCEASCGNKSQLCNTTADCPAGKVCELSTFFKWWGVCH